MAETPSNFSEFDAQLAGEVLGTEPRSTRDIAYGDGSAFDLTNAVLGVYPAAGVTRATTQDARVELFRVPRFEVRGRQIVFEQGDDDSRTRLHVSGDGKVSFRPVLRAAETSRTAGAVTGGYEESPTLISASETTTAPQNPAATTAESKERDLVTLTGHIGKHYKTDLDAQPPRAELSLAVRDSNKPDQDPEWWKVIAMHGLAVDLHNWRWQDRPARLETGWLAEVTGAPEITQRTGKDGQPRTDHLIYADAIRPVKAPRSRPTGRTHRP